MQQNERINWIDAMKGYAICMMMFSHIEYAPTFIKNYISPIFLALFFLASGYTFHLSADFKSFFLKKVRTLLFPWLIFASFNIILTQILTFSEQEPLTQQFVSLFLQIRGENDGLWFFPCMFCVANLFFLSLKFIHNDKLLFGFHFFFLLIGMFYTMHGGDSLPWHVQMWGSGCFYMTVGYLYQKNHEQWSFLFKKSTAFIFFVLYTLSYLCCNARYPNVHINFYDYGYSAFFYFAIMLSGTVFSFSMIQQLPDFKIIQYAGKNSLLYFAFHGKPKRLLTVLITHFLPAAEKYWYIGFLCSMTELVILLYMLVIPCEIIQRFFPFLLGKKQTAHLS